jgi:uncharacterized protein (DUF302 family)
MIQSIKYHAQRVVVASICTLALLAAATPALARARGIVIIPTRYDFQTLVDRVEAAVKKNDMLVVAKASASAAAEKRGVKIPGDAVILVFRNDFAVRMLAASVDAGIEAPIPVHIYATADGTARIAYRPPSTLFAPFHVKALNAMSKEMDPIFKAITSQAAAP